MASNEDVIKSITFGPKTVHDKFRIQALCAALKSPQQLEVLLSHLGKDNRLADVTDKILAFRTEDEEGYDDGSTLAAGEKLLHMLERMNVDNIVVIVFFWDYGYVGKPGTSMFKIVLDKARDLLLTIHAKVFGNVENELENKVMFSNKNFVFELPNPKEKVLENRKFNRPRHFLNDPTLIQIGKVLDEPTVSEAELYGAINQVENALRTLSQSDIIILRASSSNQQIVKVLQMVCILKGYRTCTWGNIKDMLDSRTLKIELGLIDVHKLTKSQIKMVRQIKADNAKLTVEYMSKISIPCATLLSWVEGMITWYLGRNLVKQEAELIDISSSPSNEKQRFIHSQNSDTRVSQRSDKLILSLDHQINEESEDELLKTKIDKKKKTNPEIEEKLKKTRELKIEQEERIERVLKTRLEEVDFEGERVDLTDEDIMRYLGSSNLQTESTPVLMALVEKLKERRGA